MNDNVTMVIAMGVWLMSTAVFVGGYTGRSRRIAMFASFAGATVFAGSAFGWTLATCMIGWLVGMLALLVLNSVVCWLHRLPPAPHHHHYLH